MFKIISYLRAILRVTFTGFSSDALAVARYDICVNCPHMVPESDSCGLCGCWLSPDAHGKEKLLSKVYFPKEECPLRKW